MSAKCQYKLPRVAPTCWHNRWIFSARAPSSAISAWPASDQSLTDSGGPCDLRGGRMLRRPGRNEGLEEGPNRLLHLLRQADQEVGEAA